MISKLRKTIFIIAVIVLCFNFTAFAESTVSFSLPDGFFEHDSNPERVAEILKTQENELADYCVNNSILYLAVDSSNSRQIKVTVSENSFSNSVVNISKLTDDKIKSLTHEITGIEDVRGEVLRVNDQKFLKIQLESEDSGGKYILTQYITVAAKQNIIISFTNGFDIDTDYIDGIFETVSSPLFSDIDNSDDAEKTNLMLIIIPVTAIAFLLICIGLGVSILLDIRKGKESDEEEQQEDSKESVSEIDTGKGDSEEEKSQ